MNVSGKSGRVLEVDDEGRAAIDAKSEFLNASLKGDAYTWTIETFDYEGADTVLSVLNQHSDKNLYIYKILMHGDTETEVEIHVPTATFTPSGTAIVGVNLNRTSSKVAETICKAKETNNAQGAFVERVRIKANKDYIVQLDGALVLGFDQAICVDYVTDGGEAHVSIWGYFK